jgi:DSF synthase
MIPRKYPIYGKAGKNGVYVRTGKPYPRSAFQPRRILLVVNKNRSKTDEQYLLKGAKWNAQRTFRQGGYTMSVALQPVQPNHELFNGYSQINVHYQQSQRALWYEMAPQPKPCFNPTLLKDLRGFIASVRAATGKVPTLPLSPDIKYVIGTSAYSNVFSLGGDLALFHECIQNRDSDSLKAYARLCIELLHDNLNDFDRDLTTISLIKGTAVGGGMEMALSSTVVIAERSAEMGLPEILFGLFPGMGAYQLLARRVGITQAEKMIKSGNMYKAEELYAMGVIDILAEDGAGEHAVTEYIARQDAAYQTNRAIHKMRRMHFQIRLDDLLAVSEWWVEAAMNLSERQLKLMQRIARSQTRMHLVQPDQRMDAFGLSSPGLHALGCC